MQVHVSGESFVFFSGDALDYRRNRVVWGNNGLLLGRNGTHGKQGYQKEDVSFHICEISLG